MNYKEFQKDRDVVIRNSNNSISFVELKILVMRLAQLARQLNEKTFTVREKLSEKFEIDFEKGPNTKLSDEHVAYIKELLEPKPTAPAQIEEVIDNEIIKEEIEDVVSEEKSVVNEPVAEPSPPLDEPVIQSVGEVIGENKETIDEIPNQEDAELIKAPKVKLEGIKIIDKIDLPEPKIKEMVQEDEKPVVKAKEPKRERPKHKTNHKRRDSVKKERVVSKRPKEPINRGPSMKELQQQKLEKSYKPKTKQVKGKKKKAIKKKAAANAPVIEAQEVVELSNPKKTLLGKFWWWLTNG